jgi:hypothetical protein
MADNKFKLGKIYTIRSNTTPLVYVGSTCQRHLSSRMSSHRSKFKAYKKGSKNYCASFKILEIDENCYIELHEYYPCNTDLELRKREGEVIRELDCVNKCIAGRTQKQWREDNKEKEKVRRKQYREDNPEYFKQWRVNNKEKIKEDSVRYYVNNKKKINAQGKQWRENNKEKIKTRDSRKYQCECGGKYTHIHKARHMKSKKHKEYMEFMYN